MTQKVNINKLIINTRALLIIIFISGKDAAKKMDEIFSDVFFDTLRKQQPTFKDKIRVVKGDVTLPGLGLSNEDRQTLINNVNIIIHGAATVRFDEKLKMAVNINVRGTKYILELALECLNLESFVHVSTAYSNCPRSEIEERFYPPPMTAKQILELVELLPEDKLDLITPQ